MLGFFKFKNFPFVALASNTPAVLFNGLYLFLVLADEEDDSQFVTKKGSGGKISERELYQVRLEDEDNELEAALARSRR